MQSGSKNTTVRDSMLDILYGFSSFSSFEQKRIARPPHFWGACKSGAMTFIRDIGVSSFQKLRRATFSEGYGHVLVAIEQAPRDAGRTRADKFSAVYACRGAF